MAGLDTIKLVLIDSHAMFRDGLACVLGQEPDFRISGACSSFREGLQLLGRKPDVLVLGTDAVGEPLDEFIRAVRKKASQARILILTGGIGSTEAVHLVQAGVAGIMHKEHTAAELAQTIRKIAAGEVYLEPAYLGSLMRANDQSHASGRPLTERDRRAMRAVVEGLTNREIGERLKISEAAVKASLRILFEKVGVKSRSQLVKVAMEQYRELLL